jgi:hypothetical protein
MFGFLSMMGDREQRKVDNTEVKVDDVFQGTVDTCRVTDSTKSFETGIQSEFYRLNGDWVIVESYDTKEEAIIGHKKWCEFLASKPNFLQDVGECQLVQLSLALGADVRGIYKRNPPNVKVCEQLMLSNDSK